MSRMEGNWEEEVSTINQNNRKNEKDRSYIQEKCEQENYQNNKWAQQEIRHTYWDQKQNIK